MMMANLKFIGKILFLLMLAMTLGCKNSEPSEADKKLAEITQQLQEQRKAKETAKQDSIRVAKENIRQDSIRIAKEDSIRIVRENAIAAKNKCKCSARTFRSRSDHTWVEFRLPKDSKDGRVIKISKGAYNKYVFPKCNRVYWSDLTFKCSCGTWKKTKGDWDADAFCHGSKGNSPYVFVGTH